MPRITRAESYERLLANETDRFRAYFAKVPPLLTGSAANLPAALAYQFHLIETAHHRILYGCLCRMHRADSVLSRTAVDGQHMTRAKFRDLFRNVVGKDIDDAVLAKATAAEDIRDKTVHGKSVSEREIWDAVKSLLGYASDLNAVVKREANFEAFGDMRGVTGRRGSAPLDKRTTRWLLKGMGFDLG